MTLPFDPSDDLANVADGTETVTLLRRDTGDGTSETTITGALRRATTTAEAVLRNRYNTRKHVASDGRVTAAEVTWHLPAAQVGEAPRPGDVILDAVGQRWTVLQATNASMATRWQCAAREVAVACGLTERINILQATFSKGDAGAAEPVWQTWRTGVRARIQPAGTEVNARRRAHGTVTRFQIFLEDDLALDHTHRIQGPDGTIYKINSTFGAERIGEPQTIDAEVVP